MKLKPPEKYFLSNNLYSEQLIGELPKLLLFDQDITSQFSEVKKLYRKEKFKSLNEAQLEKDFIEPVLKILGWSCLYQEFKKFHGKTEKPDFCLFESDSKQDEYLEMKQEERYFRNDNILIICESKAYSVEIDNKKIKDNPHFQLIEYLSFLRINFGFLTNGRNWRLYDSSKASGDKKFYEINLEAIIENNDLEAFKYFFHLFKKDNFIQKAQKESLIEKVSKQEESFRLDIENNLKSVIYGYDNEDSIFELIGKQIFHTNPTARLEEIYENSLYLIFRLLFIAYFEDKFSETLIKHRYYKEYALSSIYEFLETNNDSSYTAYRKLRGLFEILDRGDEAIEIPLFNGGLFDSTRARFLDQPKLIDNQSLFKILFGLYFVRKADLSVFKRDFKTLNISHLGTIYEGLLEFRFEVAQEDLVYLEYGEKGSKSKKLSGYFDTYDYTAIEKKNKVFKAQNYKKGELYLVSSSNSRKNSASYYTPSSLSKWMVKEAIDQELERNKDVFNIKILDNSCGSGHFLVEALDYLCEKTLLLSSDNEQLNKLIEDEKQRIQENLIGFEELPEIDEQAILKRLLLKKTIFGVDYNPFAIELTKLSLWISTFIFGTPLSFIEHHIKTGNSLIGSTKNDFLEHYNINKNNALFHQDFAKQFEALNQIFDELSNLKDSNEKEIKESKELFKTQIEPLLTKLNLALNLITFFKMKKIERDQYSKTSAEYKKLNAQIIEWKSDTELAENIFNNKNNLITEQINEYAREYKFFNYEIEFPEAFNNHSQDSENNPSLTASPEKGHSKVMYLNSTQDRSLNPSLKAPFQGVGGKGFQIVIGNPPWDKTKFSDMDFFSQYITDYRTLPNSKKTEIQTNWLAKDWIKAKYQKEEKQVLLMNEFYKANYPFNAGAGDGNLFRFFVEKNLSLLSKQGTLNYVLPSALMFEDGSINLRKHIFANYKINHFYSFENREAIFEEVHRSYKFALIQIGKSPQTNPKTNPQPPERGLLENENKNIVKEYAPELLDKTGHLKYNRELIPLAKQNRNNPTKAEKYIWDNLLANQKTSYKFIQQKTILNFILDFYCSELLLGIEIDGEYHEEREYQDLARSEELEKAKIKIIRYKNEDVLNNINFVKEDLSEQINKRIQEIEHFTSSLKAPFQGVGGTKTRFMQLDPDILWTNENIINYSFDLVKQISPDHLAYLELKDKKDISIIQKAYSLFPKLNPEYIDFRNELHMTADKDLFIENNPSLTASPEEGHSRTSHSNPSSKATFQGVGGLLPLYEGKMIWQFNSKFEKPKYWLDQKAFDERLKSKEISRMINDIYRE